LGLSAGLQTCRPSGPAGAGGSTTTATEAKFANGKPLPPREKKVTFVISGDRLRILGDDGKIEQAMAIKLDPTQQPQMVDLTSPQLGTLSGILSTRRGYVEDPAQPARRRKRPAEFTGPATFCGISSG
jgi:hypothetical protein